nr:hypothetical protein CPGR_04784 [Mycolicibacterium fortuitum subsp. fortuitum DSM 46621 = ATCC 6841 = JCM 6387]
MQCRVRRRQPVHRPAHRRHHRAGDGHQPGAAYAGDATGRGRHTDPGAGEPAVAVHLGPRPRSVGDHTGLGRLGHRRDGPARLFLDADHGRTRAGIPGAVRASGGARAGADRVHPHRDRSQKRAQCDAVPPCRAWSRGTAPGQRQTLEDQGPGQAGRLGRRGSGRHRRRCSAQGDVGGRRVLRQEHRGFWQEAEQGQGRHGGCRA